MELAWALLDVSVALVMIFILISLGLGWLDWTDKAPWLRSRRKRPVPRHAMYKTEAWRAGWWMGRAEAHIPLTKEALKEQHERFWPSSPATETTEAIGPGSDAG